MIECQECIANVIINIQYIAALGRWGSTSKVYENKLQTKWKNKDEEPLQIFKENLF